MTTNLSPLFVHLIYVRIKYGKESYFYNIRGFLNHHVLLKFILYFLDYILEGSDYSSDDSSNPQPTHNTQRGHRKSLYTPNNETQADTNTEFHHNHHQRRPTRNGRKLGIADYKIQSNIAEQHENRKISQNDNVVDVVDSGTLILFLIIVEYTFFNKQLDFYPALKVALNFRCCGAQSCLKVA